MLWCSGALLRSRRTGGHLLGGWGSTAPLHCERCSAARLCRDAQQTPQSCVWEASNARRRTPGRDQGQRHRAVQPQGAGISTLCMRRMMVPEHHLRMLCFTWPTPLCIQAIFIKPNKSNTSGICGTNVALREHAAGLAIVHDLLPITFLQQRCIKTGGSGWTEPQN